MNTPTQNPSDHERYSAEAQEMDRRAAAAELAGKTGWARRYRRLAEVARAKAGPTEAAWFAALAMEADQFDAQATEIEATARTEDDYLKVIRLRREARERREKACRFNAWATSREHGRPRGRASVGMEQDTLDALAALCPDKSSRLRLLTHLVREGIYAYRVAGIRAKNHEFIPLVRLNASADEESHSSERRDEHLNSALAVEFALARASLMTVTEHNSTGSA